MAFDREMHYIIWKASVDVGNAGGGSFDEIGMRLIEPDMFGVPPNMSFDQAEIYRLGLEYVMRHWLPSGWDANDG